jgi:fructose-bisphosphate aldolase class II
VSKINVNTDVRIAYRNTLEQQFIEHYDEYSEAKLIGPVIEEVQGVIERKIRAFGSAGKARAGASA